MKKSNALTIEVGTHNVTGRGDQVACSCFHAQTGCSHWIGVLLAFSPLQLVAVTSCTEVHTKIYATTSHTNLYQFKFQQPVATAKFWSV